MAGNLDIVARLQLRAEQFTSEIGSSMAEAAAASKRAAPEVARPFLSSFAEVQKIAQTALKLPRSEGGSLDLTSEIASLRASANASDQKVIALKELSAAQAAAAASMGREGEQLRLEADAAMVAARAEEQAAMADRTRAASLEAVNVELLRSGSMTRAHVKSLDDVTEHSGRMNAGQMEMMHVVRASVDAFAAGAPVSQIFAQEIGRVGEAAALSGGKLGGLGKFLGGPWGLALTAATSILGPFVVQLFEAADAAEHAKIGADGLSDAQGVLGKMFDLTSGKLEHQNDLLRLNARLTAVNLRADALKEKESARQTMDSAGSISFGARASGAAQAIGTALTYGKPIEALGLLIGGDARSNQNATNMASVVAGLRSGKISQEAALTASEKIDFSGLKITREQLQQAIIDSASSGVKKELADKIDESLDTNHLDPAFIRDHKERKKRERKPRDRSNESAGAAEEIARINAEWTDQPKLIEKASLETLKLDNLIAKLNRDKPPGFEKLIGDAKAAQDAIRDGMDRPYQQFLRTQKEGLEVQRLTLAGRDDEATAMQNAIQLQHTQGPLDQAHLATILRTAQQQRAIAEALEDQRRIVGLYSSAVGEMQQGFDQFLEKLRTKPSDALKGIVSSTFASFNHLTDGLLSNSLFGGISRDVESYVRKMTGKQTPAEILETQAHDAGATLKTSADKLGDQFDRFGDRVREITTTIGGYGNASAVPANDNVSPALAAMLAKGNGVTGPYMDDITVTAKPLGSGSMLAGALGVGIDRFTKNLETLGITMPKAVTDGLKKNLPDILSGAKLGTLGGSVFSEITGGKQSALGEAAGGALGEKAGKALEKPLTAIFGKTLGSFAGPLGGIIGGVLGDVVGGLFRSTPKASAGISVSNGSITATKASGNNADATSQASSLAGSVAQGLSQIAEQLGAAVTGTTDVKIGSYNGQWRVNDHGGAIGGVKGSGAISFDTQQEAISYAISDALKDGVLSGVSKASMAILQSGQDLSTAISKALMIEQIPKDLKAMLDPVGAAVDALNTKWKKTVAALKEGGATAEQMAQAQQLYNLQLDQTKASTDAADKTLKDFLTSLKVGSSSPYSLRDQEATAKTNLQPFLDAINGGQTIDQSKYQTAAQSYLDVERQLYGSTQQYFDAMDAVQAATNKAISTIDNATPVTTAVESPFASATATSTATTADNTGTANDLLSQNSDLLSQAVTLLSQVVANTSGGSSSSFIGSGRGFVAAA